ncbi:gamma-glutamylcyclotransferase family protein [Alkalilacustris brevis]|uniref:gamma-glutamylcyclotransferase family protein n=1 Tax=Alkalilacustris brevis TaxID=2026338 RepID=UPI000E0DB8E5|nr:gamma-glutamylcyclotransferase family protein [Alkalilacustris brevis]
MPKRPVHSRDRHGSARRTVRALLLVLAVLLVLAAATWASIRHAPFYLPRIGPPAITEIEEPIPVFGYATLTSPLVRFVVIGRAVPSRAARLDGYRQQGRAIFADPGGTVSGRLFEVTAAELHRIDRYERLGTRYDRSALVLRDGAEAQVYISLR